MVLKTVGKAATVSRSVPNVVKFFNHGFNPSVTLLFCHLGFKTILGKIKNRIRGTSESKNDILYLGTSISVSFS